MYRRSIVLTGSWLSLALAACSSPEDNTPGGATGGSTSTATGGQDGGLSSGGSGTVGNSGGGSNPATGGGTGGPSGGSTGDSGGSGPGAGGDGGPGSGGGDTTGSGGSNANEPELVTSGPAANDKIGCDCWHEGTLTAGGTTANVTVTDTAKQDWVGWGGTFNEAGWAALMTLSQADRDAVVKLLFDVTDGIGFTWGRIPIGASDYAIQRYTLDETSGDTDMASFSIDHDKDAGHGLIPFIKAALAVKSDIKFWGSAWTPPTWMKTNGAYDKGVMKNDKTTLDAYALYLTKWVQAYEAEGIDIDFVVPQNEPGWAQDYPSCAWGPSSGDAGVTEFMGDFVVNNLKPIFDANNVEADIWLGTLSNDDYFANYWTNNANKLKPIVKGIGMQWATIASVGTAVQSGLTVMQTEHQCGNYPWLSTTVNNPSDANYNNFYPTAAPNNYAYAEESWGLFKDWIDGGVNGYSAWNVVLDTGGFNLDMNRKWPQNTLIVVDKTAKTFRATPTYYLFRHVAQFVDPGAKVLNVTGGDALAFKNPNGDIVAIVHNTGGAGATTVSIGGQMYQVTIPANGWATINHKAQ